MSSIPESGSSPATSSVAPVNQLTGNTNVHAAGALEQSSPKVSHAMMVDDNEETVSTSSAPVSVSSMISGEQEVDIQINTSKEEIIEKAKNNAQIMEKKATILFANYVCVSAADPTSEAASIALAAYTDYQDKLNALKKTMESFAESAGIKNTETRTATGATNSSTIVPRLPFLQLTTDHYLWKPKETPFESVLDFCTSFERILRAHSLDFDKHWERLLPMSLSNSHNSWCSEKLLYHGLLWEQAKSKLLDYFDTPYRKFLLMAEVGTLRQGKDESTRDYAAYFQKMRREAGYQDGTQLVVSFWVSLRDSLRRASLTAIASRYGSRLPEKIDDMVELVCALGEDSSLLSAGTSGNSLAGHSPASYVSKSNNKRQKTGDFNNNKGVSRTSFNQNLTKKHNNKDSSAFTAPKKPCNYCQKPWSSGHRCKEFYDYKKGVIKDQKRILQGESNERVSRMAMRSRHAPTLEELELEEQDCDENIDRMALDCKVLNNKQSNKNGTNITFPIIINNRRAISLLDCGADFSSVDINYCKTHNIDIKFFNKEFIKNHTIRLGDKDISIKRIGSCKVTIKCNNKVLTKEFEVMNITGPTDKFVMSIGTDYMTLLGIGITGLPLTYDDIESTTSLGKATKRFNEASELLEELERENKLLENSPAGNELEMKQAMDFIQPFIDANLSIPKGSFCTIPESVVRLNTPPNATGYRKPYPIPLVYHKIVDDQIQEWLDNGYIKRATGNIDWNSPLTVTKKTNGKGEITGHRVCHDPRHINCMLQSTDRMPLPVIHELFEELQGGCVYSTLDLKSAFNSLRLHPKDAHKLSFTWRNVQYTPIATMFGIKHVSSQFQRTMSIALEGLTFCRYFVDDLVVVSKSLNEHKMHLKQVIERLTQVNLRLNPDKCKLFQNKIFLLGFHISPKGISMDRRKLVNVIEFPEPKHGKDVQRYCGLINYFRSLIPNVAKVMAPLDTLRNAKSLEQLWLPIHKEAFNKLKEFLTCDFVLSYPDLNHPFCIATDASNVGIGVVLYQKIDGEIKYISMAAKSLSKSERNYSVTKRELLAIIYALKRFHKYVYGSHFTLYTDHLALAYLHTQKIANVMLINWLDIILQYDFTVVHLPGIDNILPDALSRLFESEVPANELEGDKVVKNNRKMIKDHQNNLYEAENDYLTPNDEDRHLLLMREHVKGHFGSDAIYHSLRRQGIYWTNLKKDAIELVKECVPCQKHNIVKKGYNPLKPITSQLPGDSWGIDLAGPFSTSSAGNNYLLVMIDHATKYCILRAIKDKTAITIAHVVADVICNYGPFRKLISDNGTEFVNDVMNNFKLKFGFEHATISTYHPRSNGASERTVQSAVKTIKKMIDGNKADWDMAVGPTQLFLNCKYNERTKTPPFTLMYGRNANDFADFSQDKDEATKIQIETELQRKIKELQNIVYPAIYERTKMVVEKQKQAFDASHNLVEFPSGTKVMIKVVDGSKDKLDPSYIGVYTVVRKTTAGTYVLKNEKDEVEEKTYPPSLLKIAPESKHSQEKNKDNKYYEVERILTHKKLPNNQYLYKCRWKGYDESYDTYEPAESFTDSKFITQYWKKIGVVPEGIKERNKANKKLLKTIAGSKRKSDNPTYNTRNSKKTRSD